ncbi:MAG: glycoside hydrolase family 20 zincin-like fold domain-containing protein, partial [candidate division KSB1 bacterium]|nr:glycoside hydrolase family 20 zincin-like fold domain-containing protein [candidate division KSB1 bacterium]
MSLNLMPWPADLQLDQGAFRLGENFTVGLQGNGGTRAYSAATRVLQRLAARTGLFFSQCVLSPGVAPDQGSLLIAWDRQGELRLGEDESYMLRVAPEGIELRGKTDLGIVRGLETLLQLLAADEKGYYFPAVTI